MFYTSKNKIIIDRRFFFFFFSFILFNVKMINSYRTYYNKMRSIIINIPKTTTKKKQIVSRTKE